MRREKKKRVAWLATSHVSRLTSHLVALLFAAFACSLAAQSPLSAEQDQRYHHLIQELRCLVCQNQTIADSNAPLALDLREQVRSRIVAGESDAQIRSYLTDRYGEFVLYKPRFTARTALLWAGPFVLVLFALALAYAYTRRSRRPGAKPAAPDAAALKKLLDDER